MSSAGRIDRETPESEHPLSQDALLRAEAALAATRGKRRRPKDDAERIRLYFAQRYVDLLAADPGVRLGVDAEAVHELRVAVRRLRALLRAARTVFVREWADGLRDELGWLGRALGPLRDLDVLTAHLRGGGGRARTKRDRAALATGRSPALEADRDAARAEALERAAERALLRAARGARVSAATASRAKSRSTRSPRES